MFCFSGGCTTNQSKQKKCPRSVFTGLKTFSTSQDQPSTLICSRHHFRTLWKPCPYFEKYACTSVPLAEFCTNMAKYGQVGRSVTITQSLNVTACTLAKWKHIEGSRPEWCISSMISRVPDLNGVSLV